MDVFDHFDKKLLTIPRYIPCATPSKTTPFFHNRELIKLDSNENPLPPSPEVIDAIKQSAASIHRYPDGNASNLKTALASYYSIPEKHFVIGNGSDDIMQIAFRTFLKLGDELILSEFSFVTAGLLAGFSAANIKKIKTVNWKHNLDTIANSVTEKTRIIFLANPNNPTGTFISTEKISDFLKKIPGHVLLILDEAYYEYVDISQQKNTLALLQQHNNLLITRTFSKFFNLAGLRVGYGISNESITQCLDTLRLPFNVNHIGMMAACAALKDKQQKQAVMQTYSEGKSILYEGLNKLRLSYLPSQTNFVMINVGDGQDIQKALLEDGIIVRTLQEYGLDKFIRVTIGLPDEMKIFVDSLGSACK